MKNKKIFLLIFLILIILGVIFYRFFYKKTPPSFPFLTPSPKEFPESPFSPQTSPSLPSPSPSPIFSLKTIISQPFFAFWPSATKTLQLLNSEGLWEINYADQIKVTKKTLGVNLANVLGVTHSFRDKVLLKYLSVGASQPAYALVDIQNQVLKNFEPAVKAVTWSPGGDSLIYYYSTSPFYPKKDFSEVSYLAQVDTNLANKKILSEIKLGSDLNLSWPATSTVYIFEKPSGYAKQTILSFDLKSKTFQPFFEGYGLIIKWGRDGNYGLLFSTEMRGTNPTLQLINREGLVLAKFPRITLPEKCTFARQAPYLYCAFPQEFNFSAVWPDDYYQEKFVQKETIYRIDLRSFEAQPIFSERFFEVAQIELSLDEKELLFYDKLTKTLYSLTLE